MATPKLIDVSKLNEAMTIYDKTLRTLPYATLKDVAAILRLNLMDLQGKHVRINERRHAGGTQSYKVGKDFSMVEKLLTFEPSAIEPKDVVCITKENSQVYNDNELLVIGGTPVSNINKRHPLETRVAFTLVRNHTEDVVYAMFHSERDEKANRRTEHSTVSIQKRICLWHPATSMQPAETSLSVVNSPCRLAKAIIPPMKTW